VVQHIRRCLRAPAAPSDSHTAYAGKRHKDCHPQPLSGTLAPLGEGIKLGAQLAIEKFKDRIEKTGFNVELVAFDDQARPDVGVATAKTLIADKDILAVIGHLHSGIAIPSSEVCWKVNLVMISPANTSPLVTDRGLPNVNRIIGRDELQAVLAAEFAKETLSARSVYILHSMNAYGEGIARVFRATARALGMDVLGFEGTTLRSDFDPILTPIKATNPDVIFFGGEYPQAAPLFREAREKGIKSKFLGPDGLDSKELQKLGGSAVVGAHFTTLASGVQGLSYGSRVCPGVHAKIQKGSGAVRGAGLRRGDDRVEGS